MRELQVVPLLSQLACRRLGETGGTWTNSGDCHYTKASRKSREIFYKHEYYHLSFKLKALKLAASFSYKTVRLVSLPPHVQAQSHSRTHSPSPTLSPTLSDGIRHMLGRTQSDIPSHAVTHLWMTQSHAPQGPEPCGLGLFRHTSLALTPTSVHVHTLSSKRV